MVLLNVHYAVGTLVVLLALAAIFWRPARRYVLYALIVQILLGAATWGSTGLVPPAAHWVLAIVAGGIYAMATAFERRDRGRRLVLGTLIVGLVVLAFVYQLGQHAVSAARMGP
ncbi:MAG: hypothetical protein M3R44_01410 [Candidatus Eremiobacteraeota bacterium]|nr:hypothetical protein [Candidatus Eremiobacteraeota bacterium]